MNRSEATRLLDQLREQLNPPHTPPLRVQAVWLALHANVGAARHPLSRTFRDAANELQATLGVPYCVTRGDLRHAVDFLRIARLLPAWCAPHCEVTEGGVTHANA